jgi:hypothetical protein
LYIATGTASCPEMDDIVRVQVFEVKTSKTLHFEYTTRAFVGLTALDVKIRVRQSVSAAPSNGTGEDSGDDILLIYKGKVLTADMIIGQVVSCNTFVSISRAIFSTDVVLERGRGDTRFCTSNQSYLIAKTLYDPIF